MATEWWDQLGDHTHGAMMKDCYHITASLPSSVGWKSYVMQVTDICLYKAWWTSDIAFLLYLLAAL